MRRHARACTRRSHWKQKEERSAIPGKKEEEEEEEDQHDTVRRKCTEAEAEGTATWSACQTTDVTDDDGPAGRKKAEGRGSIVGLGRVLRTEEGAPWLFLFNEE